MNSIEISTQNAKTEFPHILRYYFKTPYRLPGYCRLAQASIWYNWKNIGPEFHNNKYSINGEEVIIPRGFYLGSWLNEFIIWDLKYNRGIEIEYDIIVPNLSANRMSIHVEEDIGEFIIYDRLLNLLGCIPNDEDGLGQQKIYSGNSHVNMDYPAIVDPVNTIKINCNIVKNDYQQDSTLLYMFKPFVSYGTCMDERPQNMWKQTRNAEETYIEISLFDQDNRPLPVEDNLLFSIITADEKFIT